MSQVRWCWGIDRGLERIGAELSGAAIKLLRKFTGSLALANTTQGGGPEPGPGKCCTPSDYFINIGLPLATFRAKKCIA